MPTVHPFRAVQYQQGRGDVSDFVAPPYDVLDGQSKAALLERSPANVVGIDLPHVPAKELGPPEAYAGANAAYREMLSNSTLSLRDEPVMFAYRQSFEFQGSGFERSGMACTVDVRPLGPAPGGGILPHEQTFSGPKEDRMALMRSTQAQLSPIFGLHQDESGAATRILHEIMGAREPDMSASLGDGVRHDVWTVDGQGVRSYQDALVGEDIFIADGHHRYNTAVNYLASLEERGEVPPDHPARRNMMVLVGMSDPGLAIGPTHRVLGGMRDYSIERFVTAGGDLMQFREAGSDPRQLEPAMAAWSDELGGAPVLGVLDVASRTCLLATPATADPLASRFGEKPPAWRTLDVTLVQHLIVEQICEPELNGGSPVTWAFPHSMDEVLEIASGAETGAGGGAGFAQLAIIVRPTPLDAVREISRANELMPQKSTFFYPKLATGLFINPLA